MIHVRSMVTRPSSSRTVPFVAVDRTSPVPIVMTRSAGRWINVAATTIEPPNSNANTDSVTRAGDTCSGRS